MATLEDFTGGSHSDPISAATTYFDAVAGDLTFSNAQSVTGGLSCLVVSGSGSSLMRRNITGAADFDLTFYVYPTGAPSADTFILTLKGNSDSTQVGDVRLASTGVLQMRNGYSAQGGDTAALATNQWNRIELEWNVSGTATLRLFTDHTSATATSTITTTSNTSATQVDTYRMGSSVGTATWTAYFDQIKDTFGPEPGGDTTDPTMVADHTSTVATFDAAGALVGVTSIGLDSSSSTDDVGITSRTWTETSGDGGTFDDNTAVAPTFTPSGSGPWVFQVEGTDAAANTGTDTVNVAAPDTGGGVLSPVLAGTIIPT